MAKKKNMLFIGLIICIMFIGIFGMFYYNPISSDDEVAFIGEPPEFGHMTNPDYNGVVFVWWYQVENAASYDLYRNVDGGDFVLITQVLHDPRRTLTYIIDRDLANGQYGYKIKAIHIDGESDFSLVIFIEVILI